ncbi:hypothetical protein [Novosphingobium sp. 9]|uniref:intermembrane phospholipid transport protein YdbH family protein n=1 Tax=Novosphingobium sp. 9 TaxID=2025349 RepID=UPI0021B58097|nr:hypothetical protein [Novosphingobium sp. 9]
MADKDNPGDDWTREAEGESLPAGERDDALHRGGKTRVWRRAVVAVLLVGVAAGGTAWVLRKRIADDLIASELKAMGLPAQYKVRTISPSEQVITDLVIGDPARPDLTVKEVHVATRLWWGLPGIGRITLVAPRLYGTVHHGKPSFGALDKVLFTGSKEPFRLPDLDIAVRDGRALIDADQGRVALKLEGQGELRGGFTGTLAALTPGLKVNGCQTGKLTAYGKLWVRAERPSFEGPIRLASASCPAKGFTLAQSAVQAKLTLDQHLDGGDAVLGIAAGAFSLDRQRAASLKGSVRASLRGGNVTARYTLTGGVSLPTLPGSQP